MSLKNTQRMSTARNPQVDGKAAERKVEAIGKVAH
jgi:UDP-N-acetylglucosamine 2-epimerase